MLRLTLRDDKKQDGLYLDFFTFLLKTPYKLRGPSGTIVPRLSSLPSLPSLPSLVPEVPEFYED